MSNDTISKQPLNEETLNQLFAEARTFNRFQEKEVSEETIHRLYELLKFGPTAFNSQPGRYLFVRSKEAREKLAEGLSSGNRDKTLAAPLTVIQAYDSQFHEHLPSQFPAYNARALYDATPSLIEPTALRNSSLQAAYLILAARSLGLDAGPMSGFKADIVDQTFFPDGRWKSNLIINLGYGDVASLSPRGPRLAFDQVAKIL